MKNILKLNTLALSGSLSISGVDIRPYTTGLAYTDSTRIIKQATEKVPVYRLCKDYETKAGKFALNLIITDTNAGKAEDFMDKTAQKITNEQIKGNNSSFVWLDNLYEVKK